MREDRKKDSGGRGGRGGDEEYEWVAVLGYWVRERETGGIMCGILAYSAGEAGELV